MRSVRRLNRRVPTRSLRLDHSPLPRCLRGCLLAIVFVLWDPHRPSRCLHHHKPGGWSQAGGARRRWSTSTAMLAARKVERRVWRDNDFPLPGKASPNAAARCRPVRRVNPAKRAGQCRRGAPGIGATGLRSSSKDAHPIAYCRASRKPRRRSVSDGTWLRFQSS
jgi:hypothetical protein